MPVNALRRLLTRLGLTVFGLLLAWLIVEIGIRAAFDRLPPGIQGDIQNVQRTPWSSEKLIAEMPFILDRDFQARLPVGLKEYAIHWGDSKFQFDTIAAWDGHRAGLRSDPPRWPLQVLTFGDSFTFCWTEYTACWVRRLQDRNDWHVFDAGIPGTGSSAQLALMKELAEPLKPQLIVWQWFNNDLTDNYDLARTRGETEALVGGTLSDPIPPPDGLAKYSALVAMLRANVLRQRQAAKPPLYETVTLNGRPVTVHTANAPYPSSLIYPQNQYGLARDLDNKRQAADLAKRLNIKLLMVLIPAKEEAFADLLTATLNADYIAQMGASRAALMAECAKSGWLCVDMLPAFKEAVKRGETVYYQYDAHIDASGNALVADAVEKAIKDNGLVAPVR